MTQLIGLFAGQREADEAMKSLITAGIDGSDIRILEEWPGEPLSQMDVLPGPTPDIGVAGTAPTLATEPSHRLELDGEAAQFFKRSVEKGGVLVVVETGDKGKVTQAKHILEAQSGQVVRG